MASTPRNFWIKDALTKRGYKQRDLARNWKVAEGSITRFISGEENQDLVMSKALTLSRMLGVSLEDLAKGLGLEGRIVEPVVPAAEAPSIPPGTLNMSIVGDGKIRMTLCQDLPADVAAQIMTLAASQKAQ